MPTKQTSNVRDESNWKSLLGLLRLHSPPPPYFPQTLPHKDDLTLLGTCLPRDISNDELSWRWSAFLFRKTLTQTHDRAKLLDDYFVKMAKRPVSNAGFLTAIDTVIDEFFPIGWDRHYIEKCSSFNLGRGSTRDGGSADLWDLPIETFLLYTTQPLNSLPPEALDAIRERRVLCVPDGNKLRLVTIGSKWQHLLSPLHHTIYDHLTSRKGTPILRGDPTIHNLSSFTHCPGEIFVSGDYEASTDNLSSLHSAHILRRLRERSRHVPAQIWDFALRSLTGFIFTCNKKGDITRYGPQNTGQMMGNFLSFPLLCITNLSTLYYADPTQAKWMVENSVVKINGDDIVFRAARLFVEKWRNGLPRSGFIINDVKTGYHETILTINSKIFRARENGLKQIWHLMPKGIFSPLPFREGEITDQMSAYADVCRENVKGAGHIAGPLWRALSNVRKKICVRSNAYSMSLHRFTEYSYVNAHWKVAEQASAWSLLYERFGGVPRSDVVKERDAFRREDNLWGFKRVRKSVVDGKWGSLPKSEKRNRIAWKLHLDQLTSFNRDVKVSVLQPVRWCVPHDYGFLTKVTEATYLSRRDRWRMVWWPG